MHIYIYICVCVCMYIYIYVCMYLCMYVFMYVCMYVCMSHLYNHVFYIGVKIFPPQAVGLVKVCWPWPTPKLLE